jgi:hypothetical protein
MRRCATAAGLAVLSVTACGGSIGHHATAVATASCALGRHAASAMPGESGVYRAGPLTLAVGVDLVQTSPAPSSRPHGAEAVAILTGTRPVVVRVRSTTATAQLSLEFAPNGPGHPSAVLSDGRQAVRFPPCPTGPRRFEGGVVLAGRGCAQVRVLSPGSAPTTLLIPIAGSLQGCPARRAGKTLPAIALPFLGVACGRPDWIGCDRIGIGVQLNQPATLVVVSLAGWLVTLSPPPLSNGGNLWLGYLEHAGLHRGPLKVLPQPGELWFGSPQVYPRVLVRAWLPDGRVASTTTATVLLPPGFG